MKNDLIKQEILKHVKDVLDDYENIIKIYSPQNYDFYNNDPSYILEIPINEIHRIITRFRALIERFCNKNSPYFKEMKRFLMDNNLTPQDRTISILSVVKALYIDVRENFLEKLEDIIHGDLFSDFIEMANHLLEEGYKNAAAVIIGSTLESHLRLLCEKNSIDISFESKGRMKPKKANRLNNDLSQSSIYPSLTQKSITGWLDLRNSAAHGKYDEYDAKQVQIMIMGVQDFIQRFPA